MEELCSDLRDRTSWAWMGKHHGRMDEWWSCRNYQKHISNSHNHSYACLECPPIPQGIFIMSERYLYNVRNCSRQGSCTQNSSLAHSSSFAYGIYSLWERALPRNYNGGRWIIYSVSVMYWILPFTNRFSSESQFSNRLMMAWSLMRAFSKYQSIVGSPWYMRQCRRNIPDAAVIWDWNFWYGRTKFVQICAPLSSFSYALRSSSLWLNNLVLLSLYCPC